MNFTLPAFTPAIPEMFVLGMGCLILLVDVFLSDRNRAVTWWLSLATIAATAWLTVTVAQGSGLLTFDNMFINDRMGNVLKLFTYLTVALVFLYSRDYLADRNLFKGEFYVLGLFGMLGIMVMISAHNFLTIYLGLELLSLSLYAMIALDRDNGVASEAAIKYFVLGAIASGTLLYGMSILYGTAGTLDITRLGVHIAEAPAASIGLVFSLGFIILGLCFKFGAVPFHMWLPDVYEGASTPVTLYVGSAPKIGAFALFMRLLVEGLGGLHDEWRIMLIVISILSMAIGSIVAIAQTNLKRMLAYSTISHVGFILLGILAGTAAGYQSAMFYTLTYVIMATTAFGVIILLARKGFESDQLDDFKGLNERSPWFAAVMLAAMFGMAGAPPFVGFFAKLYVLRAVIDANMTWLAVVAVFFSIISAYYYIRVVKLMYFDRAPEGARPVQAGMDIRWVLSGNGIAILLLGILPGPLMALCARAITF
ncbi:MAG TPA: NADH-quinone oxidoreductase subunit NuoN [Gammaproteobacteria bacterium]|jgi:NADH-quinone oxidoreductase subunit N|nr:NADH-quinone oxidoreductase subunit NuoN [Gammaproteobacteria bacterium]